MSSRYQDRDRDEGRYSREEPDRKDRGEDRRRMYEPEEGTYRSPRRDLDADRERDRARPTDRARSRSPKREPGSSRYDDRDDRDRRGRGPNNDPNYRPRTDRPEPVAVPITGRGGANDRGRGGFNRGGHEGGRGGYEGGRGGYEGGRGGYEGRGGYGGRGGYEGGGRGGYQQQAGGGDFDRPLDRRAIEEGRRKREEERARAMGGSRPETEEEEVYVKQEEGAEGEEEEEVDPMAAMMGFGGFGTTKNKSTGQYEGATANVHTQRTWRQYMNRRGGFNRALDKVTK